MGSGVNDIFNCPHEELDHDANFVWCKQCGRTKLRDWLSDGVNYDDEG